VPEDNKVSKVPKEKREIKERKVALVLWANTEREEKEDITEKEDTKVPREKRELKERKVALAPKAEKEKKEIKERKETRERKEILVLKE